MTSDEQKLDRSESEEKIVEIPTLEAANETPLSAKISHSNFLVQKESLPSLEELQVCAISLLFSLHPKISNTTVITIGRKF